MSAQFRIEENIPQPWTEFISIEMEEHRGPLLLTWFNFNASMDK